MGPLLAKLRPALAIAAGLIAFLIWRNLVWPMHWIETLIGLAVFFVVGSFVWSRLGR
ncbi:MAG: hypothetical protein AAFX00_12480 [Pseudomonadota bacterium]